MGPLVDHQNRPVSLGRKLGSGGEGAVFEVNGSADVVAKIYHAPPAPEKTDKLRAMVSILDRELTKFVSWPLATLHDRPGGLVVGVLIPRVRDHEEVHNLYSPAHRKAKFPKADWHFLVHVAMNCAAAFEALHDAEHIVGDVNQGNVLASPRGTVFLIDCDSFQIQAGGRKYLCAVGVPQFTPPELQGRSFHGIERTRNHDCFGLAVLIFHLLLLGRHPFAGRFLGRGEMPIERAIAEYRYAFSESAAKLQMAPPPLTLPMKQVVPAPLAQLFDRAFDRTSIADGMRPTAREWRTSLAALGRAMQPCPVDRGHKYPQAIGSCPWCVLIRGGAPNFFVSVTIQNARAAFEQTGAIAAIWSEIQQLPNPAALTLSLGGGHAPVVVGSPLPENLESSRGFASMLGAVALCAAAATFGGLVSIYIAYVAAPVSIVFGVWWLAMLLTSAYAVEKRRRWWALRNRRSEAESARRVWRRFLAQLDRQFLSLRQELSKVVDQARNLKPQYDRERQALERNSKAQQLKLYLSGCYLAAYEIPQVGPGRKAVLASYGVETAQDIDAAVIRNIPGFGPFLTASLVAWRLSMERQFTFDAAKAIPPGIGQAILMKYAQRRQQFELRLRDGALRLRQILEEARAAGAEFAARSAASEHALRQAQADYDLLRTVK